MHHPQDCTGDVHHGFCGGGAQIVGFDQSGPFFVLVRNPAVATPELSMLFVDLTSHTSAICRNKKTLQRSLQHGSCAHLLKFPLWPSTIAIERSSLGIH